jgi:putative salt-induced outer membrane protein YdiY
MPLTKLLRPVALASLGCAVFAASASAQETAPPADDPPPVAELCPCPPPPPPPPAPPIWTGSLAAGFSISRGNSETESISLSFGAKRDAGGRHVLSLDGLYLRGKSDGTLHVDKASAGLRDDVRLGERWSLFGDLRFLRDRFQELDASWAPTVGVSWAAVRSDRVDWALDAGVGYLDERFRDGRDSASGTVRAGQTLTWKLSPNATLSHSATATLKTEDSDDYLVRAKLALATRLTARSELEIAILDDYRNLPARPGLEKNDLSTIAAVVLKF